MTSSPIIHRHHRGPRSGLRALTLVITLLTSAPCLCASITHAPSQDIQTVQKSIAANPSSPDIYAQYFTLALLYRSAGMIPEATQAYLSSYRKSPASPIAPNALTGAAETYTASGQFRDAIRLYTLLLDKFPAAVNPDDIRMRLVDLNLKTGKSDVALSLLRQLAANPANQQARVSFIDLLYKTGNDTEAQATIAAYTKEHPQAAQYLQLAAQQFEKDSKPAAAADVYEKLLAADPANPYFENKMLLNLKAAGRLDSKIEQLATAKSSSSASLDASKALKRLYLWDNRTIEAINELEYIIAREPANIPDLIELAKLYHANQWRTRATDLLGEALLRRPDSPEILTAFGDLALRDGNAADAITWWKRAVKFSDSDYGSYRQLSNILLTNSLYAETTALYEQARAKLADSTIFSFDLANLYNIQMQYEKSFREYLSIISTSPDPSFAKILYELAARDELRGKAQALISAALDKYPSSTLLTQLLAEINFLEKDPAAAVSAATALAAKSSDPGAFLRDIAGRRLSRGAPSDAALLYEAAAAALPSIRQQSLMQAAGAWQQASDLSRARTALTSVISEFPTAAGTDEALSRLASLLEDSGEFNSAFEYHTRLAAAFPSSPWRDDARQARDALRAGMFDTAVSLYDSLSKQPWTTRIADEILFAQAELLLLDKQDTAAAAKLYSRLVEQFPESSYVDDALSRTLFIDEEPARGRETTTSLLRAERCLLSGNLSEARTILTPLAAADMPDPTAVTLLASVYQRSHQPEDAIALLATAMTAQSDPENSALIGMRLATLYISLDRPADALRICQQIITGNAHSFWAGAARHLVESISSDILSD